MDPRATAQIIGDHRVRIRKASSDVVDLEVGIVVEDGLGRLALSKQAENKLDGNAHAPDDRLAAEDLGVGRNSV